MTDNEFTRVCSLLRSAFPKISFLESPDASSLFFNVLNRYDFRDVWKGVSECVEQSQFAPNLAELKGYIERAEKDRHADERERARQTILESVKCPKCNDAGFVIITYRKPAQDPAHCKPDDPFDYTEVMRPCECATARDKYPWAFIDDQEWTQWVEDERRHGRNPPRARPGKDRRYYEDAAGEFFNMRPGRRPQVFTRRRDDQTA